MVGYEMYCQLLERAVRHLKQLPPPESVEVTVDLPGKAYIPTSYVSDMRTKIDLYRRLAKLISLVQIEEFSGELVDRFGPLPAVLISLLERAKLRVWAHEWGITAVHREDRYAVFTFTNPRKIATLGERSAGRLRIADQHTAYLVLADPAETGDELVDDVKSLLRPVELVA